MDNEGQSVTKSQWTLLLGLTLIALIIGVTAFVISDQSYAERESQIEKLANSPTRYYGDAVTLTGNVATVIDSRAITVTGPGVINDTVLVISRQPLVPVGGGLDQTFYKEGTRISLSGEARRFDLTEMEKELGVNLVDEEYAQWEGKPVIIAESIHEDL